MSGSNSYRGWNLLAILFAACLALGSSCNRNSRPIPPRGAPPTAGRPSDAPDRGDNVPKRGDTPGDSLDVETNPDGSLVGGVPVGPEGARVALMMPFFANAFSATTRGDLPKNSDWGLGYYAGLKLGLEALESAGQRGVVEIYDTEGDAGVAQRLIAEPELRASHVVIGPYLTTNVRAAVTPARAAGLPFIVPYSAASNLSTGNYPKLVQLNPGLRVHLDEVAQFLNDSYDLDQVVLVSLPNGEIDKEVEYLNFRHRTLAPNDEPWRTWRLSTSEMGLQDLDWEDQFTEDKQTVFVLPYYRQPGLVLSFMSQLQITRGSRAATVFGMPQWSEFNQLDPSILEDLNVLITAGFFIDHDQTDVRDFENAYLERYGTLPQLPAYLGYDAIRLALPLANEYGQAWVEHLPENFDGLVSDYEIQPVYDASAATSDAKTSLERLENRAVRVLMFRNYSFREVD